MPGTTWLNTYFLCIPVILLLIPFILSWNKRILAKGSAVLTSISSIVILFLGVSGLTSRTPIITVYPWLSCPCNIQTYGFPYPLVFGLDRISSYFLIILGLVSLVSSIYMFGYLDYLERRREISRLIINYPLLVLFMYLVIIVQSLFWFLVLWELMGFTTQLLVASRMTKKGVAASMKYYLLTKAPAELMIAGGIAAIIVSCGNATYASVAQTLHLASNHDVVAGIVAPGLILAGLMAKTGLIPFHSWVPDAYGESPTMASALLSGAASKVGVYMLFRLFMYFLPPLGVWGVVLVVVGTATLVYGTLMALRQADSKRLLAYHSMGQIGYVVLALGASIYLMAYPPYSVILSSVAAAAALYHAFNHSLFKTLLFMSAGAAEYAVGERSLDLLGGLGRIMPLTSTAALIAAFSISGVPPFNGFVSKWMIYASTMPAVGLLPICGFAAMFISSVTTASFIKYYTSIYGRPSIKHIGFSGEPPLSMVLAMLILAGLCVLFGVVPLIPLKLIGYTLTNTWLQGHVVQGLMPAVSLVGMNPSTVIAAIVFPLSGLLYGILISGRTRGVKGWFCGAEKPLDKTLPAPSHYYDDFENVFHEIYSFSEKTSLSLRRIGRSLETLLPRASAVFETPVYMAFIACLIVFLLLIIGLATGCLPG